MRPIIIVGAGGFAREVAWLIEDINRVLGNPWMFLGYVEGDANRIGSPVGDSKIVGDDQWLLHQTDELDVVIAIGSPTAVSRVSSKLTARPNLRFPNLVHPTVQWNSRRIDLGSGNIICAGNILTTDIHIGSFNILNLASTFGHDAVIADCCVINPGVNLSGGVHVGHRCLLGTGSVILENRVLGDDVVVGAGAVVTKDVPDGTTVVGIPAKPLLR